MEAATIESTYAAPVAQCEHFPPVALPTEFAQKIIARIVRNKRGLLNAFPHLRPENGNDMNQEMFMIVDKAWKNFDLSKVASTYIGEIVGRRIIDVYRRAKVKRSSEQKYHRLRGDFIWTARPKPPQSRPWLSGWPACAFEFRRLYPDKLWAGKGKFKYSLDQAAGIAALMTRLKLTDRGCRMMLTDFPELRRALRMKSVPSRNMIAACLMRVERLIRPSEN